jgi:protein-L-isoaspartate(D-aspartate) O-methyltransferase
MMANPSPAKVAREHMVDSQVRPNQVNDRRVIDAMRALPREAFAPKDSIAYADMDIDLGGGRFLLAPMVTARLAQLVLANSPKHVLVIGAGSGYLAAVLAAAGADVVALEEEPRLNTGALAQYAPNVAAVHGKLADGWPSAGAYDVIVIEGAVPAIPEKLVAQLTVEGRVVTILADGAEPGGLGRAVVAEPAGSAFTVLKIFDCTARLLPQFQRAPSFSF